MITNAVVSTRDARYSDPVRLWVLGSGVGVLFLVWVATTPAPARRVITPDAEHGRGLNIVEALSDRWGSFHASGHPGGKVVWARAGSAPAGRPVPVLPVRRAPAPPAAQRQATAKTRSPAHSRQSQGGAGTSSRPPPARRRKLTPPIWLREGHRLCTATPKATARTARDHNCR
jgi:hypothetical protein